MEISMKRREDVMPKGAKRCSKCRHIKPLGAFWADRGTTTGRQSQCKICHNVGTSERRRTKEYLERLAAHRKDPEVRNRIRATVDANREAIRESQRRYRRTPRGKVMSALAYSRRLMAKANAAGQVGRAAAARKVIEACERELRRLETIGTVKDREMGRRA
jgi:hypothetical protein